MSTRLVRIFLVGILAGSGLLANAQASKERKTLLGNWLSEERTERIEFRPNGVCIRSFSPFKTKYTWKWSITDTVPDCGATTVTTERDMTYLRLIDESGIAICYWVNGFTDSTFSVTRLGLGGALIFYRLKKDNTTTKGIHKQPTRR